jgi:hypothetical protein
VQEQAEAPASERRAG